MSPRCSLLLLYSGLLGNRVEMNTIKHCQWQTSSINAHFQIKKSLLVVSIIVCTTHGKYKAKTTINLWLLELNLNVFVSA